MPVALIDVIAPPARTAMVMASRLTESGSSHNTKTVFFEFYIKDNGQGVDEQYFDKVFEIFRKLGRREDTNGTGAGLAMVKKIIHMHKGRIWLSSKKGEGTTFYFTIPKQKDFIMGRKKIGEILVNKKLVNKKDVEEALEEQKEQKEVLT